MRIISFKNATDPTKPPWFGIITISRVDHIRREKRRPFVKCWEWKHSAIKQIFDWGMIGKFLKAFGLKGKLRIHTHWVLRKGRECFQHSCFETSSLRLQTRLHMPGRLTGQLTGHQVLSTTTCSGRPQGDREDNMLSAALSLLFKSDVDISYKSELTP